MALNTLNELASEIIRYTDSYNEKITQENHRKEQKYWFELDPYEFEKEVANWFSEQGYEAKVTKKSGDEGVDVIITKNNYIGYVQCKRYTNSKVDRPTLNALYGVVCANKATQGIIVCLQGVTAEAKDFAKKTNIRIITVDELAPNEDLFFHKEIKQTISNVPIKCNEYWCKIGYIILNTNCYHEETDAIKTIDKWQNSLNHAIQYNGLYYIINCAYDVFGDFKTFIEYKLSNINTSKTSTYKKKHYKRKRYWYNRY